MILTPQERQQALRVGLLGNHTGLAEQYNSSSLFRQQIDLLTAMLPAWVEGLAKESFEREQQIKLEIAVARLTTFPLVDIPLPKT